MKADDTFAALRGLQPIQFTKDGGTPGLDLFTIEEFKVYAVHGVLTDYDGFGHWATETHAQTTGAGCMIFPSKFMNGEQVPPHWATHVTWFNR